MENKTDLFTCKVTGLEFLFKEVSIISSVQLGFNADIWKNKLSIGGIRKFKVPKNQFWGKPVSLNFGILVSPTCIMAVFYFRQANFLSENVPSVILSTTAKSRLPSSSCSQSRNFPIFEICKIWKRSSYATGNEGSWFCQWLFTGLLWQQIHQTMFRYLSKTLTSKGTLDASHASSVWHKNGFDNAIRSSAMQ